MSASSVIGATSSVLIHALTAVMFLLAAFGLYDCGNDKPLDSVASSIVPIDVIDFSDYSDVKAAAALAPPSNTVQPEPLGAPPPEAAEDAEEINDPNAKPRPKPKQTQKAPDLEKVAEYIDRSKEAGKPVPPGTTPGKPDPKPRPCAGFCNNLTASEMDYMRSKIETCWRSNLDSENRTKITVRVQLNRDGTIKGDPVVMQPRVIVDQSTKVLARRAVNAVKECGPYKEFQAVRYEYWKLFDLRMGVDEISQ